VRFSVNTKGIVFTARLLQVFLLQDSDISEWFREYGTKYYTERGVYVLLVTEPLWIVFLLETEESLFPLHPG
jgi:hypothetical protein